MTAAVAIEIKSEALVKALAHAPAAARRELGAVLLKAGIAHENVVKRNRFGPYRGEAYFDRLQRRSGKLSQAYQLIRTSETEISSVIRKGLPGSQYARIQEFGGTVRPKKGQYLTVPTKAALTAAGVLSGKFKIRRGGARGYTTDAGDTFIFRGRGGELFIGINDRNTGRPIAKGRGPRRPITAFYVLRRSVTIKPRFGFFAAWKTIEERMIPKLLDLALKRAIGPGGAAGG